MKKLRTVTFLVSPENPCPPLEYGGGERVASILVREFLMRGLEVELFCAPGSTQQATFIHHAPSATMEGEQEYLHALARQDAFHHRPDVIVDMTPSHIGSLIRNQPIVSIMGGDPLKKYPHDNVKNRIYASQELAEFFGCPDHPVLHNVVTSNPYTVPLGDGSGGYALYVGITRPGKGLTLATRAARLAGLPLHVYGPALGNNQDYLDLLVDWIEYKGMLSDRNRWQVFGKAAVYMCCPVWCDAGPLAPMEAMLTGTPVVGLANGGVASDVVDGVGGYLLRGKQASDAMMQPPAPLEPLPQKQWQSLAADLAALMPKAAVLDRARVRQGIIEKVNPKAAADVLEALCRDAAAGKEW